VYNFARVPVVHSRDAFWAIKHPDWVHHGGAAYAPHDGQEEHASQEPPVIHMPSPSYFPLMIAVGLLIAASGLLTTLAMVPIGALIILAGIFGWAYEPV
jgi:cytochrome c oxidase subunit 1